MVSLQAVVCPYCHGTSYFASDVDSGYCTGCGRIIYATSAEQVTMESTGDDVSTVETHDLTIRYVRCGISHSRTMMVVITGPERKEFAVNVGESMKVTLPEGEYQIIGTVHVNGGVNSADIIGSKVIVLSKDLTVEAETRGVFSGRIIFK